MGIYDQLQTISTPSPTPKMAPKERKQVETKKEVQDNQSPDHRTNRSNEEHSPINLPAKKKNDNVSNNASKPASTHVSTLASTQDDIVETIRKTVKQVGKDTLFVRLTSDEKHQVTSVVYALNEMYRGESRKTSENEIGRIGVNFLLEDYKINGEQSILAKVLAALNA